MRIRLPETSACCFVLLLALGCDSAGDAGGGDTGPADGGETDSGGANREYPNRGVCGVRGEATVLPGAFNGFEEHYLIGEEGLGRELCRVRYSLRFVEEPEVPCDSCSWTAVVEKGNPEVLLDEEGTCARSALRLDEEAIRTQVGQRIAYGYTSEYVGHSSVLMQINEESGAWEAVTFASYDEASRALFYDHRDGYCGY